MLLRFLKRAKVFQNLPLEKELEQRWISMTDQSERILDAEDSPPLSRETRIVIAGRFHFV
ncbi:hypothetical protein SapgrDRAFT_2934 [Saprospira grandis DSM 2844]|uniref:Uncharacterized protein n=1 Tax=Saprospira grandis DSM 2844 TaxID=694433 RepID=J1I822_9BACT|nr:hypothetical protein SapgrDRAFT_2934 [Saprospira grandis DSM 2844]